MSNEELKEIQNQILQQIKAMREEARGDEEQRFLLYAWKEANNMNLQTAIRFMMEAERDNLFDDGFEE